MKTLAAAWRQLTGRHWRWMLAIAVVLVIAGALGLLVAWELSVEKVLVLADPEHVPACNVGVLVGCGVNLESWQGLKKHFKQETVAAPTR